MSVIGTVPRQAGPAGGAPGSFRSELQLWKERKKASVEEEVWECGRAGVVKVEVGKDGGVFVPRAKL